MRAVQSYLSEKSVLQGLVLRPILWNIYYDYVMRLQKPVYVKIFGYAVDLAMVVLATTQRKRE